MLCCVPSTLCRFCVTWHSSPCPQVSRLGLFPLQVFSFASTKLCAPASVLVRVHDPDMGCVTLALGEQCLLSPQPASWCRTAWSDFLTEDCRDLAQSPVNWLLCLRESHPECVYCPEGPSCRAACPGGHTGFCCLLCLLCSVPCSPCSQALVGHADRLVAPGLRG